MASKINKNVKKGRLRCHGALTKLILTTLKCRTMTIGAIWPEEPQKKFLYNLIINFAIKSFFISFHLYFKKYGSNVYQK
jgi:hypothetical protein